MADETVHAFQSVEVRGEDNQPTGEWKWVCTCGAEGKPSDDNTGTYDRWIEHQNRTFAGEEGSVGEEEPAPQPVAQPTVMQGPPPTPAEVEAGVTGEVVDVEPEPLSTPSTPTRTTAKKTPAKRAKKT